MVRYPQQNPPQPINPKPEGVSSKPDKKQEEVQQLQERLRLLEKKLVDIQTQKQSPQPVLNAEVPKPKVGIQFQAALGNAWKTYRWVLMMGALLGVMVLMVLVLMDHLYISSFALELRPKEFNVTGQDNKSTEKNFIKFEEFSGLINELMAFNVQQLKTGQDGKYINVRIYSLGAQHTRKIAENRQISLTQKYIAYRKSFLVNRIKMDNKKYAQYQHQMEDTFGQMEQFKSSEKYFLVNGSSKEKLIQLTQQNAIELEKNLVDINDQLANSGYNKSLISWSKENKVLLGTYSIKLTEMEFKKFLVGPDFLNVYEEGIRAVKTSAAQLINDQADRENMDEISASLMIKYFFLRARRTALEAVLNKRFVVDVRELSGRLAQYIHLKSQFEELNQELANISMEDKQIWDTLNKGLSQEVVVRLPLKVEKF